MPRRLLLAALLLAGLALPHAAVAEDAKKDIAQKKAAIVFKASVNRAIARGARWVASMQRKDGSFRIEDNTQEGPFPRSRHRFGITALCTYTLADCGYGADHEVIAKALPYLRNRYKSLMKGDAWTQASAYSLSILVLALHNLYVKPANRARLDARDRYGARSKTEKNPCGYPAWARTLIKRVLDWLLASQSKKGLFRYPGGFEMGTNKGAKHAHYGDEDLSNTQYVLLALWAGARCGYKVDTETLEAIARRLLPYQERLGIAVKRKVDPPVRAGGAATKERYAPTLPKDDPNAPTDRARGFPYTRGGRVTGSMTTAGLSSLLIVKAMLLERGTLTKGLRGRLDKGVWDAFAWLQENYTLGRNPGTDTTWQYYYLYGLERACVIAQKRFVGVHDWYHEGAGLLVDVQKPGGRWQPEGQLGGFGAGLGGRSPFNTSLLDTCFALLFLKRATLVPEVPVLDEPKAVTTGK